MRDFTKLDVWSRSHALSLSVFYATRSYPNDERFELRSQTRRAATSIPTNIAEGAGRHTRRDYARFLAISAGSANELEYLLVLGTDLGYLPAEVATQLRGETREIRAMLTALARRVASPMS